MHIQTFPSGPIPTNAYLAICSATGQAVVIDPAPQSAPAILEYLKSHGLTCQKILLTHSHWDHIADVHILKQALSVPVFIHPLDTPNLEHPGADGLPCPFFIPSVKPDGLLEQNQKIPVGNCHLQVLHTPGHSPGSICFYEEGHHVLLSGDTLFQGSMGNISFPTSQPNDMWQSLKSLAQLPAETKVYPGHGASTTIGREQSWLTRAQELYQSF